MCRLLDPDHIVIHDDLDGVAPYASLHGEATVVEPDLAVPTDGARQLAEAEAPPEVGGLEPRSRRLPQHDRRRELGDPAWWIPACMGPMSPTLIILPERRMLVIHPLALCTATTYASDIRR